MNFWNWYATWFKFPGWQVYIPVILSQILTMEGFRRHSIWINLIAGSAFGLTICFVYSRGWHDGLKAAIQFYTETDLHNRMEAMKKE